MANKPLKSLTFPDLADTYTIPTKVSDLTNDAGYVPFESIATAYSTSATYAVGDYVWYSGQLYQFTTAHAAGAWNASHATAVQIADQVSELKSAIENLEAIPRSVKMAMDTLFSKAAYADADAASSYATFHAWATANPVTSITAVFTQGSAVIYDTDSLDMLKQYLVVTASFADSTTATVTDYTLSGTLTVGTSTITVSYDGETTTFNVTVTQYWTLEWDYTDGTPIGKGFEHSTAVTGSMVSTGYQIQGTSNGGCNIILSENGTATRGVTEIVFRITQIKSGWLGFHFDVKNLWAYVANNTNNYNAYYWNESGNIGGGQAHTDIGTTFNLNTDYKIRLDWDNSNGASLYIDDVLAYSITEALAATARTRWFLSVDSNESVAIIKSMKVRIES